MGSSNEFKIPQANCGQLLIQLVVHPLVAKDDEIANDHEIVNGCDDNSTGSEGDEDEEGNSAPLRRNVEGEENEGTEKVYLLLIIFFAVFLIYLLVQ